MEQKNLEIAFIFKRSFLGFFWVIVFLPLFIAYFWFKSASPETLAAYGIGVENPYVIGCIIIYGIIGAVYAFITGHTKYIERVIRLMSDKNGEKMMPKQSLLLSRKIFKETVKFRLSLFFKYYSVIALVYVVTLFYAMGTLHRFVFSDTVPSSQAAIAFVIAGIVVLFGWMFTHFFLAAKTRFIWFTYMTHYGDAVSNTVLFDEVKKLNNVDSKDDRGAIVGYIKRDMSADVGSFATSSTVDAVASKGLGSDVIKGYARGMAIDAAEYSKIKLNYSQYKEAYNKVYGKNPELSSKLLGL